MKISHNIRHSRESGSPSPTIFGNRKRRRWIPAFAGMTMLCLSPVQALETEAGASPTETSIDPARLAAAKITVDHLFPLGTYERMMKGTMDQLMDSILGSLAGIEITDASGASEEGVPDETETRTVGELASEADPHFEERMKITTKVMMDEMIALMITMEPQIRNALADIFVRKYTTAQLAGLNSFFATETGGAFARDYMLLFTDPEMMQAMTGLVPEMMSAMPEIMKKAEKATKHLPPVSNGTIVGASELPAGETGEEPWYESNNWSKEDRKQVSKLVHKNVAMHEKYKQSVYAWKAADDAAVAASRVKYKAQGWKPEAADNASDDTE